MDIERMIKARDCWMKARDDAWDAYASTTHFGSGEYAYDATREGFRDGYNACLEHVMDGTLDAYLGALGWEHRSDKDVEK
jgi:hypothetical protein